MGNLGIVNYFINHLQLFEKQFFITINILLLIKFELKKKF